MGALVQYGSMNVNLGDSFAHTKLNTHFLFTLAALMSPRDSLSIKTILKGG